MNDCALINKEEEKNEIEVRAEIERTINEFLIAVGLKPNQRELIRAFIAVSEAHPYFEAAYKELGAIVYGGNLGNKAEGKRAADKIRNNIKTLLKWQEANGLEIIQIVTYGNQIKTDDGQFQYNKTRFYFSLLDEILKSIHSSSADSSKISIEAVIGKLKEQYQPVKRREPFHPNHRIQKAIKTVITKIDTVFALNIEAQSDPIKSCERLLREATKRFEHLKTEWTEKGARKGVMADFERLLAKNKGKRELSYDYFKEGELPLKQ